MPSQEVEAVFRQEQDEGNIAFIFQGRQFRTAAAAQKARQVVVNQREQNTQPSGGQNTQPSGGQNFYGNNPSLGVVQAGDEKYSVLSGQKGDVASSGNTYKVGTGPNPNLSSGIYTPAEAKQSTLEETALPTKRDVPILKAAPITEKPDEFLTTTNKLLEGTRAATAKKVDTSGLTVAKPKEFDVKKAEATRVAGEERTAEAAQKEAPTFKVGDLDQSVSEKAIAEAQTDQLDQKALVRFQLEQLYSGFEGGNIPAWASGAARNASNIMARRGLGASSMAAAAIAQSIQETATPIAQADAQSYATIQLQNLNNRQQATLANAATYAAMDRANLDARTTAAVTNAQSFLAIDTANLTNRQQAAIFNAEAHNQFLLSDQAAENVMEQLNTKNQVEIDRFFSQLGVQIDEANKTRLAAIRQFNAEQETTVSIFNTKTSDQRERFNAEMIGQIEAANTQWRRTITTINNANQQSVNQFAASSQLTYDLTEYQQLWQKYRDDAARIFTTSENQLDRAANLAIAQLSSRDASKARKTGTRNALISAAGSILGGLAKSDIQLKTDINKIGEFSSGLNIYTWEWNDLAKNHGLAYGPTVGVLAQELQEYKPEYVTRGFDGFLQVDYDGLLKGEI